MSRVSEQLYDGAIADLSIVFTTDNPAITPDSTVTIADGDNASSANLLELGVELTAKVNAMLAAMRAVGILKGEGAAGAANVPQQAPAAITVTFTTDNPSITPNSAITIADGDNISAANTVEAIVELATSFNNLRSKLIVAGVLTG